MLWGSSCHSSLILFPRTFGFAVATVEAVARFLFADGMMFNGNRTEVRDKLKRCEDRYRLSAELEGKGDRLEDWCKLWI